MGTLLAVWFAVKAGGWVGLPLGTGGRAKSEPPLAVAPFNATEAKRLQQTSADSLGVKVVEKNGSGQRCDVGDGGSSPTGEFWMGPVDTEIGTSVGEKPQHRVRITKPFFLGKYDVTQEQYKEIIGRNPSWFAGGGPRWPTDPGIDTSQFPVDDVSWDDAVKFVDQLNDQRKAMLPSVLQRMGYRFRLPTEAQWEYACRAGTTTPFHFGAVLNGKQANCGTGPRLRHDRVGPFHRTYIEGGKLPQ